MTGRLSEWGSVIPDSRLIAALVRPVAFNAHIIETDTESYRLRTTKTRSRAATAPEGGVETREPVGPIQVDKHPRKASALDYLARSSV